jgi:hypothetical protein
MTIPSSGPLSLTDIQTEFGGSNPISLSEYYAGGANVPSGTTGDSGPIPSSGTISMGQFYGASNRVAITLTISADTNGYNIFNNRGGTYVAGLSDVTLVNNANIYSTSGVALDTGTGWTAGDTITIDNNALIVGHGGDGGAGGGGINAAGNGAAGGAGSTAFNLQYDITLDNTGGTISGGSGGGGGGGGAYSNVPIKGGSLNIVAGGGGGGAGRASASGAAGGVAIFTGSGASSNGSAGNASSITTLGTGGSGGSAASGGVTVTAGAGGSGGANTASAGANGANGVSGNSLGSGGTGGAGGKAVNLNGNSITYIATGTIYGAVS